MSVQVHKGARHVSGMDREPMGPTTRTAALTKNELPTITLEEAAALAARFRAARPNAVKGLYLGHAAIEAILDQDHCAGMRMYHGVENDGTPHLVSVGVDPDGNDLFLGRLSQRNIPCPPYCGFANPLNSGERGAEVGSRGVRVFNGHENHDISLEEAVELTDNFRAANPGEVRGFYLGRNALEALLAQEGCVGIRAYFGLDDDGHRRTIIVGVEADGNDMFYGVLLENTVPGQHRIASENPLNSQAG